LLAGEEKYIPRAVWIYIKMKNRDAPFIWIIRVTHPILISRIIISIVLKTVSACGKYLMESTSPVMIWRVRVIPRRNPIFHSREIDEGVGRSIKEVLIIFNIWLCFISFFFILEGGG
jgi:hypothetical protein